MTLLMILLACQGGTQKDGELDGGASDGGSSDGGGTDGGSGDGGGTDGGSDGGGDGGGTDGGGSDGGGSDGGGTEPPAPALVFAGERPVNVLIVSVDTLRRDQVGVYSGLDTTPTLDLMLEGGLVLDDHRSCANWTGPSMICATNGRWPLADDYWPTGVWDGTGDRRVPSTAADQPTLASLLGAHGYATGVVSGNSVFSDTNTPSYLAGFEFVEAQDWAQAPILTQAGLRMQQELADTGQPWLLHLHYIDPHGPYGPPAEYVTDLDELAKLYDFPYDVTNTDDVYSVFSYWPWFSEEEELIAREHLFGIYRGEIRYWDSQLEVLFATLQSRGALDDTLVVFFADHGEQFGEHDQFQHGKDLFSEENRVLGAFWARDLLPGTWSGPTQHQDLAPTVLEALGLPAEPLHEGSVVGLAPADRSMFSFCYLIGYCDPMMAIVKDGYQLVYRWDGKRFFYDLAVDPGAIDDLYEAEDPRVEALWAELRPQVEAVQERWSHLVAREL